MTHWHSPRFHAYFPSAQSYPSLLGDLLSGTLGCVGFSWVSLKSGVVVPQAGATTRERSGL